MDKIAVLRSLLAKTWHVAYRLEMEARKAEEAEARKFFHDLNGEINALELKLIDFVRESSS